jgi:hypothetical protein
MYRLSAFGGALAGLKISLHIAQGIVGKIESFVPRTALGFHHRDNLVDDLRIRFAGALPILPVLAGKAQYHFFAVHRRTPFLKLQGLQTASMGLIAKRTQNT